MNCMGQLDLCIQASYRGKFSNSLIIPGENSNYLLSTYLSVFRNQRISHKRCVLRFFCTFYIEIQIEI